LSELDFDPQALTDNIAKYLDDLGNELSTSAQGANDSIGNWANSQMVNVEFELKEFSSKILRSLEAEFEFLVRRREKLWLLYPKLLVDLTHAIISYPWDNRLRKFYAIEKLGLFDYISLYRRKELNLTEFFEMTHFLGYNLKQLDYAKLISEYYPSTSDLVSFAVREAFEPDEKLFIHDKNAIPEPFSDYGNKIGLKDEWIKRFWHSHWRLLGAEQILEAFHRGFIKRTELLEYLRRLDYTENDRELILSMSYNLLTRVDVRRVFEQGLISSKELYDYYGTLGFSENDKILMISLAKQLRFIDTKDLRKLYIDEFEQGLTNESEVKENLRATGLDLNEINLYLNYSDKVNELKFVIELKSQITQRFYEGSIDFDELVEQLRGIGVSNRELKRIEKNAVLFDFRKTKLPTIAELKRYLKKGIIDLTKFVYYALRIGYTSEHIFFILSDLDYKM